MTEQRSPTVPQSQVIHGPSTEPAQRAKSVFLAGSTSQVEGERDWRARLIAQLGPADITIYDPARADWDATWREEVSFEPFRRQVEWELERQETADLVVVYLHPATRAPVSLLELGLWARWPGKTLVCCPDGFWKRGNVQIVCARFGIEMVSSVEALGNAILQRFL